MTVLLVDQKLMRTIKNNAASVILGCALAGTLNTAMAATISDIVRATPSASVYVFVEDGVATLSGSVPASSTRDLLISAAREMSNVSAVDDQLLVSEQLSLELTDAELIGSEFQPTGAPAEDYSQE